MGEIDFAFYQPHPAKVTTRLVAEMLDAWDVDRAKMGNDCKIEDILYKQYAARGPAEKVIEYINLLTPDNCYIIHRNKAYENLPDLKTEPIYNAKYSLRKIEEEKL